jgi:hypothetical protein
VNDSLTVNLNMPDSSAGDIALGLLGVSAGALLLVGLVGMLFGRTYGR